ncbi:dienelactone hydrolase family protein [Streptomyces sp. Ncost-T10-10d]|uniref:dienelactone hydrolase family protein n=1 Tax=Streptomyces sp. Ncost-T10-10d TaxID=1839774 RepID=UPI00081D812B|nr:dienelactone hydrolase family protein [Streptomyces sp. Ncost-T10-10d]SCF63957.1 Dienelactone hydrolase family protein [Streptomyces sp. Ncost-T10-10d]
MIGPDGPGLNEFQRRRADALAELGYVALAFDVHGGRWFTDPQEMLARVTPLLAGPDRMRGIGHAALDVLRAETRTDPDRIAAIGYGTASCTSHAAAAAGPVGADVGSRLTDAERRGLTALFRSDVNPCGTFRLDMDARLDPGSAVAVPHPRTPAGAAIRSATELRRMTCRPHRRSHERGRLAGARRGRLRLKDRAGAPLAVTSGQLSIRDPNPA